MQILKVEMECPHCRVTAKLPIKSINRRVRCPRCLQEFVAIPGDAPPESQTLDVRKIEMTCTVTQRTYTLTFERTNPGELYRRNKLVISNELIRSNPGSGEAAPRSENDTLDWGEIDQSDFTCSGCGSRKFNCSTNCCNILFCGGSAVETRYASCPLCGRSEYYSQTLEKIYASGTQTTSLHGGSQAQVPPAPRGNKPLPPETLDQIPPPPRKQLPGGKR